MGLLVSAHIIMLNRLITAEDGPRLSAFLAEWDESRRNHSIRSAQVSHINTEIWNKVQTARVTVAFYEGSMLQTHTRSFQGINGMISMRGLRQMDLHFAEHQG